MKTTLLQVSFLQSIVCLKCGRCKLNKLHNPLWGVRLHCLQFCLQLNMMHFLWSTAALCRSNSKSCSFNIVCTSTINENIALRNFKGCVFFFDNLWIFMSFLPVSFGHLAGLFGHIVMWCSQRGNLIQKKQNFHVQNGLLHDNGWYRCQNVAESKKKTHLGKQHASRRMLRQTMQDCSGEVQVMNSPYPFTKATLLWREGNLGVLGCGVTRWQLRNCKKTRVKLY